MSSPALTLLGVTLVLAGLLGILVVAIVRLRSGWREQNARPAVSEEVFMATAMREVLAGGTAAPVGAPSSSLDATIVAELPAALLVVRQGAIVARANAAALRLLQLQAATALPARLGDLLSSYPALVRAIEEV